MIDWTTGVHPTLVMKLKMAHGAMGALGLPMRGTEGLRTQGRQAELYLIGRRGIAGEKIVTLNDGITHPSNHQPKADGLGHAVDSCFLGPDPYLEKDPRSAVKWACFGACLEAVGLKWGGRFHNVDGPHAEIP